MTQGLGYYRDEIPRSREKVKQEWAGHGARVPSRLLVSHARVSGKAVVCNLYMDFKDE